MTSGEQVVKGIWRRSKSSRRKGELEPKIIAALLSIIGSFLKALKLERDYSSSVLIAEREKFNVRIPKTNRLCECL